MTLFLKKSSQRGLFQRGYVHISHKPINFAKPHRVNILAGILSLGEILPQEVDRRLGLHSRDWDIILVLLHTVLCFRVRSGLVSILVLPILRLNVDNLQRVWRLLVEIWAAIQWSLSI